MNRLVYFLFFILLLTGCVKQPSNSYTIKGSIAIDSLNGEWVYLVPSFKEIDVVIDSALITDNKFKMKGDVGFNSYLAHLMVTDYLKQQYAPLVGANMFVELGLLVVSFNSNREKHNSDPKQT